MPFEMSERSQRLEKAADKDDSKDDALVKMGEEQEEKPGDQRDI